MTAVRWGKCQNVKFCKEATHWQHIPVPIGSAFVCPGCGVALLDENADSHEETSASSARNPRTAILAIGAIALVLLAAFTLFAIWGRFRSADASTASFVHNTILRLAGSNTIGSELGPALAVAFLKDQGATDVRTLPGANQEEKIIQGVLPGDISPSSITITAHGSATAFQALSANSADVGMASRAIKPDEASKLASLGELRSAACEHILGLDGIAVIVNASNPINALSKEQIRRIFTGEIADWSKAGAYHGAIHIYARNDDSGTYDTFKTLVLAGQPLAPGAQRIEDSRALSEAVASDRDGIGFIGLPYIQSAKPIAVSEKGSQALLPTRLTVATEDYLLSRRLFFYTPSRPDNQYTRRFIEYVLSKKGQDVVGASGFVSQNVTQISQPVSGNAPNDYRYLTANANRLSLNFRFTSGQTALDNKAMADLDRVVSLIADLKISGDKIMLFGFSDGVGSPDQNKTLSLTRAKAVAAQFSVRGLNPAILRGYGAGLPVASNDSGDGQARNRRVEIWVRN